ncbi:MAG: hypothetical protein AAGK00_07315 [Pseudomonadota bacterium]
MPNPKRLRPDHHILLEARELLEEAEEQGIVQPGAGNTAEVLDGSAYDIAWADDEAEKIVARRGNRPPILKKPDADV